MAVADDEAVGVHVGGEHGVELGLGACLETEVVALAVAYDFLYDGPHLVDLDGEDDEVLGLVVVLLGGLAEALVGLLDAVVEDVGEAQEHGCCDVPRCELVDDFLEVDLHAVFLGRDVDVALVVDAEIVDSPALDVVELFRVFDAPFFHLLFAINLCFASSACFGR